MDIFGAFRSKSNTPLIDLTDFKFISDDHIRYENGTERVPADNKGEMRGIRIQTSGKNVFSVSIYNMSGIHPIWRDNVQMAPKQMEIVKQDKSKIMLRGFGRDSYGSSFADYGLTLHMNKKEVEKATLHMFDRNVHITYLKATPDTKKNGPKETDIESLAKKSIYYLFEKNDVSTAHPLMIQLFHSLKHDANQLKRVKNFASLGDSLLFILNEDLFDDIDNQQLIASVSYLCFSKAIEANPKDSVLYKHRLFLLNIGHEPLIYTVISALNLAPDFFSSRSQMAPISARDAIYRMEICDLNLHPELPRNNQVLNNRKVELDKMIHERFFRPEKSVNEIVKSGKDIHEKLKEYLQKRIIENEDIDF